MLFSYTLLFAILTTFVVAAPARTLRPDKGSTALAKRDTKVLELPAKGIPFRDAAKYLAVPSFSCWIRLPSPNLANLEPGEVPMISFFKDNDGDLLYHHQSKSFGLVYYSDGKENQKNPPRKFIGYWYQTKTNRMMKITLEEGNYLISSLSGNNLNHIPIAKPGKELRLTDPMAAYYVAAAGGTWTKSSDLGGGNKPPMPVNGLSFDFDRHEDLHVLTVKQHFEGGSSGGIMPVESLVGKAVGNGLIGVWRLESKVSWVKSATIKIEFKDGTFYMNVLPDEPTPKESSVEDAPSSISS